MQRNHDAMVQHTGDRYDNSDLRVRTRGQQPQGAAPSAWSGGYPASASSYPADADPYAQRYQVPAPAVGGYDDYSRGGVPTPKPDYSAVFGGGGGSSPPGDGDGEEDMAGFGMEPPPQPGFRRGGGGLSSLNSKQKELFFMLVGAAAAIHLDLNMAAPHLSKIAADFGLSPMEKDTRLGGMVQFGFFLVGGACSLLVGPMADQGNRVRLLVGILAFSCVLNLILCFCLPNSRTGFFYFFMCRVGAGISIGGCFPVLYSLCGDLFSQSQRSFVAASIGASANVGAAVGSIFSGMVGEATGWRFPYLCVACIQAAFVFGLQVMFKDPRETKAIENAKDWSMAWAGGAKRFAEIQQEQGYIRMEDLDFTKFRDVGAIKTNKYILLQAIPGCIPISLILTFLPDYLVTEMGMSVRATVIVITAWGIAGLGCAFLGGATGQYLYETNKTTFARFLAVCTTLGAFPFLLLTNCSPYWITRGWVDPVTAGGGDGAGGKEGAGVAAGGVTFFAIFLALCGGIVAATGPNVRAVLMHVNSSNQRGTVFSALTLCDDLGKGFGPTIIVIMIWFFGRRVAFTCAFCCWWISAFLLYQLKNHIPRDSHNSSLGLAGGGSRYD